MTRDELHEAIDWLDSMGTSAGYRTADFLRQIADAKPEHWAVELRWADRSRGGDWRRYDTYITAEGARHTAIRAAGPGDIAARVVPLYRLPLED